MKIIIEPSDIQGGFGLVPSGGIILWKGTIATIPSGWALCDGTNGTPDLRDKFIVGAISDSESQSMTTIEGSPLKTGGSKNYAITLEADGSTIADSEGNGGTFEKSAQVARSLDSNNLNVLPPYYALAYVMKLP